MNDIIFFLEGRMNKMVLSELMQNYNHMKIFSLDYESHEFLEKLKIAHYIGEDYLTNENFQKMDEMAIKLTINWIKDESIKDNFFIQNIFLPELIEQELFIYFRQLLIVLFTIIQNTNNENPKKIISSTSVNDFVSRFCESKNISTELIKEQVQQNLYHDNINIKYNLYKLPFPIDISRKNYQKIEKKIKKMINFFLNINSNTKNKEKKSILLLNFNTSDYESLLYELSKLEKNVLLLNLRRPAVSNLHEFQIIKNSKCSIVDLNAYKKNIDIKIQSEQKKLSDNVHEIWKRDDIFQTRFSIDSISFWFSIKEFLAKICISRFNESIERIMLLNEFFKINQISTILEWAEVGQEEKECVLVAKKYNIPSIMLQHGKYSIAKKWDSFARFLTQFPSSLLSNKQAVWGDFTKKYAIDYGHDEKNLIVTGSPRHDKFFNFSKNIEKQGIILFATTGPFDISSDTSTTSARIYYEKFVKEVCNIIKDIPKKKLIIKPHPSSQYTRDTINLLKKINAPVEITLDTNLPELISKSDLLITFNNSTIALESVILGVPVLSIQTGIWAENDEISKMKAVRTVTELNKLEKEIKQVLFDESIKQSLQKNSTKFLDIYMANQGDASKKLAEFLNNFG